MPVLVITIPNHGFNVGDQITITGVNGFNGALNGQTFTVINITTNTFAIQANVTGSYVGGGSINKFFTMNFQYRCDWNVSWNPIQVFNYDRDDQFAFAETVDLDIGTIENMFQMKIQDNSTQPATTIYGMDLFGTPLGSEVEDRATS